MAESELHRKGNEIRRRLLGDKYVERVNATTYQDPVMRTFIDVATENVFGALWSRPGLDLKTRTLVCVVSDAATGREPELRIHLRMALGQGWTEQELIEVLIHLSGYVGVPIIREAMICARRAPRRRRRGRRSWLPGKPVEPEPLGSSDNSTQVTDFLRMSPVPGWHFPCTFVRVWPPAPTSSSSTTTR